MGEQVTLPQALAEALSRVRSVGAITGAGISKESGIQTYRGKGGLYDDPEQGDRTVEALSGSTLLVDPDRTWRAIAALARQAGRAWPSAGHRALVAIEGKVERFVLLTQNVDGLHHDAGNRNIIDIHGNVFDVRCMSCGKPEHLEPERIAELQAAPRCPACGGVMRPDAILFGEMLPPEKVQRMTEELCVSLPDLVLVAGTSAVFPYISEPVNLAARMGKLTVEINTEPTVLSEVVDFSLRGPAAAWLPLIAEAL